MKQFFPSKRLSQPFTLKFIKSTLVDLIDFAKENGCATVLTVHDHWGFCHRQKLTKPVGAICNDWTACSNCQGVYMNFHNTQQPIGKRNFYVRYRLRLDREPEDHNVVKRSFSGMPASREAFLGSLEYRIKNTGIQLAPDTWVIKQTIYGKGFGLPLIEAVQHGLPLLDRGYPSFPWSGR